MTVTVSHPEVLWSNKFFNLTFDKYIKLQCKDRIAYIDLNKEQILSFENISGKMFSLFQTVWGAGDFTRWIPLHEDKAEAWFLPARAYSKEAGVDMHYKVQQMAAFFFNQSLPPISKVDLLKIKDTINKIFSSSHSPPALTAKKFRNVGVLQGFNLLCDIMRKVGQKFEGSWKETKDVISLRPECGFMCNRKKVEHQLLKEDKSTAILIHPKPYSDKKGAHFMLIPKSHRVHLSELTPEENLEIHRSVRMLTKKDLSPQKGLLTRQFPLSGQTQSHLHSHYIGFDQRSTQPWVQNWANQLAGLAPSRKTFGETDFERVRKTWL